MPAGEKTITTKNVKDSLIASIRFRGEPRDAGECFARLSQECGDSICGPGSCLYHYDTGTKGGIDVEVCFPVSWPIETGGVKSRTLPGGEMLSILHRGPYELISDGYRALSGYARQHGLVIGEGPEREIYQESDREDPAQNVTEIQLPLHRWDALLSENVERALGKEACHAVMEGAEHVTPESSAGERTDWARGAVERLVEIADQGERYEILSGCAHVFPEGQIEAMHALHERSGDVDRVIEAIRKIPGYFALPVREGNLLYVEKVPFDRAAYEAAMTPAERRKAYCHCPLIRERLDGIPDAFCYCGAGWFRQQWEGILGEPVRVDVVKSPTKGDDVCRFAIHLPQQKAAQCNRRERAGRPALPCRLGEE